MLDEDRWEVPNILFGALKRQISVLSHTVPPLNAFGIRVHSVLSSSFAFQTVFLTVY